MPRYRQSLPQLAARTPFLSDGGLETTLVFLHGVDLPLFAAFPLLRSEAGRALLREYFTGYLALARQQGRGFVLDTPTWRASRDWGIQLGFDREDLAALQAEAVAFAVILRQEAEAEPNPNPVVINGVVGPRGDGYRVQVAMSVEAAARYHRDQVAAFAASDADMVSAITMTYAEEAIGIALAARDGAIPVVISFTVETDGRLPSGETLADAIRRVDAATDLYPAYYMVNCAHPTHFEDVLAPGPWRDRIRGIRANASTLSHAELDAATELDAGDPVDLGRRYRALMQLIPHACVLGGCCGTDLRHVAAICEAC